MIQCKAKKDSEINFTHDNTGNVFVSFNNYVLPCCWMGSPWAINKLLEECQLDKKYISLDSYSIQEIIDGPIWKWIDDNMESYFLCNRKCVKHDRDLIIGRECL